MCVVFIYINVITDDDVVVLVQLRVVALTDGILLDALAATKALQVNIYIKIFTQNVLVYYFFSVQFF